MSAALVSCSNNLGARHGGRGVVLSVRCSKCLAFALTAVGKTPGCRLRRLLGASP